MLGYAQYFGSVSFQKDGKSGSRCLLRDGAPERGIRTASPTLPERDGRRGTSLKFD